MSRCRIYPKGRTAGRNSSFASWCSFDRCPGCCSVAGILYNHRMRSQSPQRIEANAPVTPTQADIPYTRLTALLTLVAENPSTLEPLLHELRGTRLYVPVDGSEGAPLGDSCLFCSEREGGLYGIAFLREADAREYFRDHQGPYSVMLCQGSELVSSLTKRDSPLGLYLVDGGYGFFLNADLMDLGASLLEFRDAEVVHVQYAPAPYSGVIPKELRTELDLLCSKHPHIERVYLSELISEKGSYGSSFIVVGDHDASPVNVQELLSIIATRVGVTDWKGTVTWIEEGEGEEILRRNHIDLVYARKK